MSKLPAVSPVFAETFSSHPYVRWIARQVSMALADPSLGESAKAARVVHLQQQLRAHLAQKEKELPAVTPKSAARTRMVRPLGDAKQLAALRDSFQQRPQQPSEPEAFAPKRKVSLSPRRR